jgi:hypothetical protein
MAAAYPMPTRALALHGHAQERRRDRRAAATAPVRRAGEFHHLLRQFAFAAVRRHWRERVPGRP